MSEKFYTVKEVMEVLGIKSNRTIYRYIREGKLNCSKLNERLRFTEADIQEFLAKNMKKVEK